MPKQVIQNIKSGELSVKDIPAPAVSPGCVLIANQASLISAGTEKMIMDLSKKSLLGKARERPDQVRRVLEKVRNEGLIQTFRQVQAKLDEPMTMGYSSAGVVLACGDGVSHFKPGDRVASNGPHAQYVSIPTNLCGAIPDSVDMEHAAFAILGSIAMQGVRLTKCKLGEAVFVIGLGLVGQLAVTLLKAAGIRVIGTDLDRSKCELAMKMGAEIAQPGLRAADVEQFTCGLGADAVLITASTKSNQPIELSAAAVRQKGRVVLVGVVGLELDRRPFYFKEAEFVVSCSYGPGRYNPEYEDRGYDFPAAYVRWTEQRNIQSVLDLMGNGSLDVSPLISHRFPIEQATEAYSLIENRSEPFVGVVLTYPELVRDAPIPTSVQLRPTRTESHGIRFGVLGAGNFARMVLLPAISAEKRWEPACICTSKGVSGTHTGESQGFEKSTTDEDELFADPSISTVFSLTRHDQHARHVLKAINSGKNIFVEKPLCLTVEELEQIENALDAAESAPVVMVGFNRRFAPATAAVKEHFSNVRDPLTVSIRFNAGQIPGDHWTQHDQEGGGRIIGEACHAIDLATFLVGSPPVRVYAESIGASNESEITDDQCFITLRHANGSISSVGYLAGGSKSFPKERVEVIGGGRIGVIDDFRAATLNDGGGTKTTKFTMDKGHRAEVVAFADGISAGNAPITWRDIRQVALASILAVRSLREGTPFDL